MGTAGGAAIGAGANALSEGYDTAKTFSKLGLPKKQVAKLAIAGAKTGIKPGLKAGLALGAASGALSYGMNKLRKKKR